MKQTSCTCCLTADSSQTSKPFAHAFATATASPHAEHTLTWLLDVRFGLLEGQQMYRAALETENSGLQRKVCPVHWCCGLHQFQAVDNHRNAA